MPAKSTITSAVVAFIGSVISTFGTIYIFVQGAHASGGHERHDRQVEAVEARAQASQNHLATQMDARLRIMESSSIRIEQKQDQMIRDLGGRFPRTAPPFEDLPAELRPGGLRKPLFYWPATDGGSGMTSTTPP